MDLQSHKEDVTKDIDSHRQELEKKINNMTTKINTGKAKHDELTKEVGSSLDEDNMDWSPQTNYHRTHCAALDTPNLSSVKSVCMISNRYLKDSTAWPYL